MREAFSTFHIGKGKAIPLQAWTGPEGYRTLRLSHISRQQTQEGRRVVSPKHRPPLPARKYLDFEISVYVFWNLPSWSLIRTTRVRFFETTY